eukprot:2152421-Prymnesium_polylepis.1
MSSARFSACFAKQLPELVHLSKAAANECRRSSELRFPSCRIAEGDWLGVAEPAELMRDDDVAFPVVDCFASDFRRLT